MHPAASHRFSIVRPLTLTVRARVLTAAVFAVAAILVVTPPARAVTATGLSSFEAIEEPLVKFFPASARFEPDAFINITDVGGGTFRFTARYNQEWWDADRDTHNKDRQRAEVKGLGPHQKDGEIFEYGFRWRSNPGFRGSDGFCHLFQLKAINGDSGLPLITLSIRGQKASVEANTGGAKIIARQFPWQPDTWQHVRIRVKTSQQADGELFVSVDGDGFEGKSGVAIARPGADTYRPKWGLYRRATLNAPMSDDWIEHADVTAVNLNVGDVANTEIENAGRLQAQSTNPAKAAAWVKSRPPGAARDFALASIVALWAEASPFAAMAWAEKLPPSATRADAILRVFSRWADQNVVEAIAWLKTRAPDPALDPLVWLLVTDTTYRYVRRDIALEAAPLIHDSALRAQALTHVLEIWARTEGEAARAFLEQTPALTPEQKAALTAKLRR